MRLRTFASLWAIGLVACAALCFAPVAHSQQLGLSTLNPKIQGIDQNLFRADALLRVGDVITTYDFLHDPCHCFYEANPIAPSGNTSQIVVFQAGALMVIGVVHNYLINHHHPVLARLVLIGDVASESYAVGHNIYIVKEHGYAATHH